MAAGPNRRDDTTPVVVEVPVEATFGLREQLLRRDRPDLGLRMPDDRLTGTFHLAVLDSGGDAVGITTLAPSEPVFYVRRPCYRLRQMAVDPGQQGHGIGAALLSAAIVRLRSRGVATVWAESRDSSLGFYQAHGLRIVPGRHHQVGEVTYTDVAMDLARP